MMVVARTELILRRPAVVCAGSGPHANGMPANGVLDPRLELYYEEEAIGDGGTRD